MNVEESFGTAFNCMDGRCQKAVSTFVQNTYGVRWVDSITEPGIDGILSGKRSLATQPGTLIEWIRQKAEISAQGHGSKHAVVVGHAKCAGNNVSDSEHIADIGRAVEAVRQWNLFETVEGLMVSEVNGNWQVSALDSEPAQAAA